MKTKIEELTIEGVTYIPKNSITESTKVIELNGQESPYVLGEKYLVRTVTMTQLGRLIMITDKELVLENACWVADTGRFSAALLTGELNEVEMFCSDVIVSRGAIVDATIWLHDLPIKTK